MECDKQLETSISQAFLEVEKDLFLPHNTLVDTLSKDHKPYHPERKTSLRVFLDKNFMARVPEKHIQHSRELKLRKRVAEQDETISLLVSTIRISTATTNRNENAATKRTVVSPNSATAKQQLTPNTTDSNINMLRLKFKHAVFCSPVPTDGVNVNDRAFAGTLLMNAMDLLLDQIQ